jgi:hypothetical protein
MHKASLALPSSAFHPMYSYYLGGDIYENPTQTETRPRDDCIGERRCSFTPTASFRQSHALAVDSSQRPIASAWFADRH